MTTYSFIQYDVLNNLMSFKGTPTPGLKTLIKDNNSDISSIRDILQNDQYADDTVVPTAASSAIISFLEATPEIDLANSKTIILTIEIIDDTSIGNTVIVSKNLDKTKTVVTKGGLSLAVENIKPLSKWKTMGKCDNCLKFAFSSSNAYNFTGNLGGAWNGTFKNGQKVYEFYIPNYSSPSGFGSTELYKIYWKPNITYSGIDYNGTPFTITNKHKWIATPATTMDVLNDNTFFHVLDNFDAPCPYALAPSWYNFFGKKGFFLLNSVPQTTQTKPCPNFIPTPGTVNWGYNCGTNGCVSSPSGSIGEWATLAACQVSCSLPPATGSSNNGYNCIDGNCVESQISGTFQYATLSECQVSCSVPTPVTSSWYVCTQNGCAQVPSGSAGAFVTLAECEAICFDPIDIPTSCSCDPDLSPVLNPSFYLGSTGWTFTPSTYTPGVGSWDFSQGYAQVSTGVTMSAQGTSSVSLTQANLFTLSCSYDVCFQAWTGNPTNNALITIDTGNYTTNLPQGTGPLTTVPTAYSFTINNIETNDLTLFFGLDITGSGARINVDNVCVTLIGCPPPPTPLPEDCYITGSISSYVSASYDCLCPEGYVSDGSGSCAASGSFILNKQTTGILVSSSLWIPNPSIPIPPSNWNRYNAVLYYQYNSITGLPTSSIGTGSVSNPQIPSPYFGDSRVFNSAYTFDFLKQPFWKNTPITPNYSSLLPGYASQLIRKPITPNPTDWYGGGSFLNITSSKTYYVGLIGDDVFRFTISGSSGTQIIAPSLFTPNYGLNSSVYPQAFYGNNPYLPFTTSSYYSNISPGAPMGGNMSYSCLHIYPIYLNAGCYSLKLEAKQLYGDILYGSTGLGGVIFDMTTEEILNASSSYNLNTIWDSRTDLIYSFTAGITASCPPGSIPLGPNPCDQCISPGGNIITIPCGNCLECTHGLLYNGYVVDKGSATLQGRGPGGIVNTGSINATTWVIPTESDWNNLVTFLNNGVAPTSVTITGSLGTIAGGKLKDYTRDLEATCWENPNLGAQTNTSSSGWAGTAGGRRKDDGTFEGLGFEGLWWSANSLSTPPVTNGALMAARRLEHYSPDVYRDIFPKSYGCSIRLVRPAATGEVNGMFIPDAYVGKNGTIYDGIVINDQVWIDKNLSETLYNNGVAITNTIPNNTWSSTPTFATPTSCYYNNDATNANIVNGNINPATQGCYTFPTYYVYEKCDGSEFLAQPVSGSTTTIGKVLKDSNSDCWSYYGSSEGIPPFPHTYSPTNYFSGSNVIYNNCNECEAIHTIYMKFGTKNC
jgi:hypothetical protein